MHAGWWCLCECVQVKHAFPYMRLLMCLQSNFATAQDLRAMERREAKANSREKTPPLVATPPNPQVQMQRQEHAIANGGDSGAPQVLTEEELHQEHSPNQIKLQAGTPEPTQMTDLLGGQPPAMQE